MKNSSLLGGVLVLIGALCFSTTGFTQALIVDDGASSYAIGTIRMLLGGLLLLLYGRGCTAIVAECNALGNLGIAGCAEDSALEGMDICLVLLNRLFGSDDQFHHFCKIGLVIIMMGFCILAAQLAE